ncbi:hypothetical protein [Tunturiibacter lichenicola]|uniref:hypothetical protein n=1 Tax=Tunturiibacter lichenicola TaxID=2051959 RepID=UPI003D9AF967
MNLIETLRAKAVRHERGKIQSFEDRRSVLLGHLASTSGRLTAKQIIDLGDHLSAVFQLPEALNNRTPSGLNAGGSIWTALVGYYLNLCLAGTDAIALTGSFIPKSLKQALMVTHSSSASTKLNSDIDLIVVNLPGASLQHSPARRNPSALFSEFFEENFRNSSAIIIQTKTNWNDNSQIPMLWNLVYKLAVGGQVPQDGMSIGTGPFHITALKGFGYAFATVPTQKRFVSVQAEQHSCRQGSGNVDRRLLGTAVKTRHHLVAEGILQHRLQQDKPMFPRTSHDRRRLCAEVKNKQGIVDIEAFDLFR